MRYSRPTNRRPCARAHHHVVIALAATLGATALAAPASALDLSIGGIGVSLGTSDGLSVGVSLGSTAGVDATVGGSGGLVGVSADLGDSLSTDLSVGGSDGLVSVGVGSGSGEGPSTPDDPQPPAPDPDAPPSGEPTFPNVNAIPNAPRLAAASHCPAAGNYEVLNGIAVLDRDNAHIGTIVGAYVDGPDLTRVRVAVDPQVVAGGGCVEYTTAGGRASPQGIVVNTTREVLVSALDRQALR